MRSMHMLVGIHEVSFTHLKKKKRKKFSNSPKSKQYGQDHQISALQRNRLTESHGISSAIRAPSGKGLLQIAHTIVTKWTC